MRAKSSFMFAIAACTRFSRSSSVRLFISAPRSSLSFTCRERSITFGFLFGGGPTPGGGPAGFPWPKTAVVKQIPNRPVSRKRHAYLGFGVPEIMRGPPSFAALLINANIVDQHPLRENCCLVRVPRPATTHRHIQDQKERMIENPRGADRQVRRCPRVVQLTVHIKADHIRLPLDGEEVEIIR